MVLKQKEWIMVFIFRKNQRITILLLAFIFLNLLMSLAHANLVTQQEAENVVNNWLIIDNKPLNEQLGDKIK
jgi:hypothetical protein